MLPTRSVKAAAKLALRPWAIASLQVVAYQQSA